MVTKYDFNPRSHERSDGAEKKAEELVRISIHAPTRGATTICFGLVLFIDISIHAPTRGATKPSLLLLPRQLFQSTLPREERRFLPVKEVISVLISIHAPTRGATAILHKKFVYFYTIPTINI